MQKKFKIEVDCANCAAKIETAVKALPGVNRASVSFMTQKMLLDADDARFAEMEITLGYKMPPESKDQIISFIKSKNPQARIIESKLATLLR